VSFAESRSSAGRFLAVVQKLRIVIAEPISILPFLKNPEWHFTALVLYVAAE
jgi:hypothetical protein